jgi:hypothetical protein
MTRIDELGRVAGDDLARAIANVPSPRWRPASEARRRRVRSVGATMVLAIMAATLGAIAIGRHSELRTASAPPSGWVRRHVDATNHSAFSLDMPNTWQPEPTDQTNVYEIYRAGDGGSLITIFEQQVGAESVGEAARRTAAGIRQKGGTIYSIVRESVTQPGGMRLDFLLGVRQAEYLVAGHGTLLSFALAGPPAWTIQTNAIIASSLRVERWGPSGEPEPQREVHAGHLTVLIPAAWRDVSGLNRPPANAGTDLYDADGTDATLRVLLIGPITSLADITAQRRDTLRRISGHPVNVTHPHLPSGPAVQFDGLQSPQPGDPTSRWIYRNYLLVSPDGRGYLISLGGPETTHTRAVFDTIGNRLSFTPSG